jgi:hypothetical protein
MVDGSHGRLEKKEPLGASRPRVTGTASRPTAIARGVLDLQRLAGNRAVVATLRAAANGPARGVLFDSTLGNGGLIAERQVDRTGPPTLMVQRITLVDGASQDEKFRKKPSSGGEQ